MPGLPTPRRLSYGCTVFRPAREADLGWSRGEMSEALTAVPSAHRGRGLGYARAGLSRAPP
jgi:hypothetical protein